MPFPSYTAWAGLLLAFTLCGAEARSHEVPSGDSEQPQEAPDYVSGPGTLEGLHGVHVFTDYAQSVARKSSRSVRPDLTEHVERMLQANGIPVLTREETDRVLGEPEMQIYLTVKEQEDGCCFASVWISVIDGGALIRDPEIQKRIGLWGGGESRFCRENQTSVDDLIENVVNDFIRDYRLSESAKAPVNIEGIYKHWARTGSAQDAESEDAEQPGFRIVLLADGEEYAALLQTLPTSAGGAQAVPVTVNGRQLELEVSNMGPEQPDGKLVGEITRSGISLQDAQGASYFLKRVPNL